MEPARVAPIIAALQEPLKIVFTVLVIASGCILLLTTEKNFGDGHSLLSNALLLALYVVFTSGLLALVMMLCNPAAGFIAVVKKKAAEAKNHILKKLAMVSFTSMAIAVSGINFFLASNDHGILSTAYVLTFFTVLVVSSGILQLIIVRPYAPHTMTAARLAMIV